MANALIHEKSPYLRQHAQNPVDWYPWCEAAFEKALREDKPVFLSIGYSTCHWCHVMARECFEDREVARVLNEGFVCIKVDREERPDIDAVYMRACQAMTGGGGWPASIFMTAEGKPFFAGTYFPKQALIALCREISRIWKQDRATLLADVDRFAQKLAQSTPVHLEAEKAPVQEALANFEATFDGQYGGFGAAPKFPTPHNLWFLLRTAPALAEKTLLQMYKGGLFDHVGGGFARYSTDRRWLVPHFEKMLYDNALLAMTYLLAYEQCQKPLWKTIAQRVLGYLQREMRCPEGGFYAAQDADSGGREGRYYVFTPDELIALLGREAGDRFCAQYGIEAPGNFEGASIPNLLHSDQVEPAPPAALERVYQYRRQRMPLHTDCKRLTGWNALAAAAYAAADRIAEIPSARALAQETLVWIEQDLTQDGVLFAGMTEGHRAGPGFLDDYAFYIFALLQMHQATLDDRWLESAAIWTVRAHALFYDEKAGGYYFSGAQNEKLIARPKETWDGAMPSGNSVMAYNLSRLALLCGDERFWRWSERQNRFLNGEAAANPAAYGFYLYSALPCKKVLCAVAGARDDVRVRSDWAFRLTKDPAYPVKDGRTTYYVCEEGVCLPPSGSPPG